MSAMKRKRGARVAQARETAGHSQSSLAAKLGIGRQSVIRLELGEQTPSVDLALAISRELGESVESLFGGGR